MKRLVPLLILLTVAGCATVKPNKAVEVTSDSLLALAQQVDTAEKRGWITDEVEYDLITKLRYANSLLAGGSVVADKYGCTPELTKQECLNVILLAVEKELAK